MKQLILSGLIALGLTAAPSQQASANGPFGFTIGVGGTFSFGIAPYAPCGGGAPYPGYAGCCNSAGMMPAYAYMGDPAAYYGQPTAAPADAKPKEKAGNGSEEGRLYPRYSPSPQGVAAYYPYGAGSYPYQVPPYWQGR